MDYDKMKEQLTEFRDSALQNLESILSGGPHTPPPVFYQEMSCAEGMTFNADVMRLALIGLEVEKGTTRAQLLADDRIPVDVKRNIAGMMALKKAGELHGN